MDVSKRLLNYEHSSGHQLMNSVFQAHQKRNWLLTYNSPTILDENILMAEGLDIDQLVCTKDRALNYLYFHLDTKVRQTTVDAFLDVVGIKYGVRVNEIFGFDAVSSAAAECGIHSHPGFWTLMKHENSRNDNFRLWIKTRADTRKGFLLLKRLASCELAKISRDEPEASGTVFIFLVYVGCSSPYSFE